MVVVSLGTPGSVWLSRSGCGLVVLKMDHHLPSAVLRLHCLCSFVSPSGYNRGCVHPLQNYNIIENSYSSNYNWPKAQCRFHADIKWCIITITLFPSLVVFLLRLFPLIIAIADFWSFVTENILKILHIVVVVVDLLVVAPALVCNLFYLDTPLKGYLYCS